MQKLKNNFEIPFDIKNDLVYCQRALTNHILIHQKIVSCAAMSRIPNARFQKSMRSIEREIMDIGDEQKLLFNQLRFFIDYHQLTKNEKLAERERLTKYVRDELQNFSRTSSADIKPVNVQPRLNEEMLYAKYMRTDDSVMDDEATRSRDHSSANSISDEVKTEPCSEPVSGSDEEKMEVLVEPLNLEQKVYSGPRPKLSSKPASIQSQQSNASNRPGQSLLKPIYQRKMDDSEVSIIRVVRPEVGLKAAEEVERKAPAAAVAAPIESQPAAICLSRLNLKAALFKAKDATKTQATQKRIESPETVAPQPLTVKCDVPLSLSQSSNASSSSSVESELLKTETDPVILGQEGFLRMLGLVTPAYSEFVMNRRPQRKKRMCTSTERGDFHYGKSIELFERQFSKRNNRQFLYSPPATRAKRRIGSNGSNPQAKVTTTTAPKRSKGIKKTSSSSSSISSNGSTSSERVCLICHKNNNLIECQRCCGKYHAACHLITDPVVRKVFCPQCVRQQKLGSIKT